MDDVKKKVLLDLFVSPWVIVPMVGGLSAWMLSWGMDGSTTLNMIGLAGVLAGMGIQASRLIFGIEDLTKKAHTYVTEQEKLEQEQKLDQLMVRLKKDGILPGRQRYLSPGRASRVRRADVLQRAVFAAPYRDSH